jgi:hypothetical protein
MKKTIATALAAGILLSTAHAGAATPAQQAGASNAILLQGFHWNSAAYAGPDWYNTLLNNVGDLSTMGFTHVWFPPPSDSAAREGYLPRQLNKLDSSYGSAAELTNVISAFKSRGVKAIADVVVNHRVGTTGWSDFTIMNWINATSNSCGAFDFTTKGILNDALANGNYWRLKAADGKPQGAIGWWPAMSVTFVDNHDTGPAESCGSGQNLWPAPCAKVMEGYAYILSHPGIPTVFYPHIYNWNLKTQIAALMKARKSAGVNSTSAVAIQQASQGLYAAIVTGTAHQLAMKIGPNSWSPGAGWTLQTSGTNYAVWMK